MGKFIAGFSAFFLLVCGVSCITEYETDEGVLVLTKDNFNLALSEFPFVLVEFYAPWCGHCKQLAPEYAKAAQKLESEGAPVKLAKVDATQENTLAEEYGIRGYPTLKFFKNRQPFDYGGGREAETIISWLKKKIGPPAKTITSVEEMNSFLTNNTVAVVGYFKDTESDSAKTFLSVASSLDDYEFAILSHEDIAKEHFENDDEVVLFKQFDDKKVKYENEAGIAEEPLKTFVQIQSLPVVVDFTHTTAAKIFGGTIKSHLLMFVSKKDGHYEQYLEGARNVAKAFQGKVLFVTINIDEEDHIRIMEYFGLKKEEAPTMRIIKLEEDMIKYKPQTESLEEENVASFVSDFVEGKLKQHYLSQTLPEDWNVKPVKVLVADNFKAVVMDSSRDVLVEFYAPWCGHCKQLAPIYDQLAEKFEGIDDVIITKMDATLNELEDIKVTSFPTIYYFTKDKKDKPIEYTGERTLEAMLKFVESRGASQEVPSDDGNEEEEEKEEPAPKDEL